MVNWYMKGGSEYVDGDNPEMWFYIDMDGFAEGDYDNRDLGDIETNDPYMRFYNAGTLASPIPRVEIGLSGAALITIDSNGVVADDLVSSSIVIDIDTTGCNNYDLVYVDGTDSVAPADADDDTKSPAIGIVIATGKVLTHGVVYDDDLIKCTTSGAVVYASTTLREVTETPPSASGNIVQVIGICVGDHKLFVNPSLDWVEIA